MNNKLIIFIIPIFFLISCNNEKTKNTDNLFIISKELNYERLSNFPEFLITQYVDTDSINLFITLENTYANKLTIYDADKGNIIKTIDIPTNDKILGFYVEDMDNIYIITKISSKILKINDKNNFKTLFKVDNSEEMLSLLKLFPDLKNGAVFELMNPIVSPFIVEDSNLFITNMVEVKRNIKTQRPFLIFNFSNDSVVDINSKIAHFPVCMYEKNKTIYPFNLAITFTRNKNKETIVNFLPDHNLYIYDNNKLIKVITAKSENIKETPPFIDSKEEQNPELDVKRYTEESSYVGIYYDKYRDIYYRTLKIGQKYSKEMDENDFKYSIMVLDNQFNILGEQIFDNNEYILTSLIVTKEGVMLRKPDDLSGISRYKLFTVNYY